MYKIYTKETVLPNWRIRKILLVMRLTTLILIASLMQVSAATFGQRITLSKKNVSLENVLKQIRKQSGYDLFFDRKVLKNISSINVSLSDASLDDAMKTILSGLPLTYTINGTNIAIKPKEKSIIDKVIDYFLNIDVKGRLLDENRQPLVGASVKIKGTNRMVVTNEKGEFSFSGVDETAVLVFSFVGFEIKEVPAKKDMGNIQLGLANNELDQINVFVSTGYQTLPKERSTGSFSTVSKEVFNQQVGTDILSRLSTAANGITVDRGTSGNAQIMVRGLSTINGPKAPLIVVDNFPYEGDINNINPNMVETITILKDAAAASIWGARAANGVIVITTKNAQLNKPLNIEFNANTTIASKPDLGYIKAISSSDFIDVEQELFRRGFYNSDINSPNHPVLSPVVDILRKQQIGVVSNEFATAQINDLRKVDSRDQFLRYMYSPSQNQQYFLSLSAGAPKSSWDLSMGYDHNKGNLAEIYERLNLRVQNSWKPLDRLSINTAVYYTTTNSKSGRLGYGNVSMKNGVAVPYMLMADNEGKPLPVVSIYDQYYKETYGNKLLDWNYYPLTDWQEDSNQINVAEIMVTSSLNYKIVNGLEAQIKYQHQRQSTITNNLHSDQSFYARNYINNFAQVLPNGTVNFIVPKGGILDKSNSVMIVNNLRGQLNFNRSSKKHNINAILGAETRDANVKSDGNRYYGYDERRLTSGNLDYADQYPTLVSGSYDFVQKGQSLSERNTKYVSLYANAAYSLFSKYTISASARRDASNLFGLKTNDQWNPFWSTGLAWKLSEETFYKVAWMPYLNIRASYGFNGNIDPAMVAVSTIAYDPSNSSYTGSPMARFENYYNPNLRWETSRMTNVAVDFGLLNSRISGSFEYFLKRGTNLFGTAQIDYTTGIGYMLSNVASTKGKGLDIELRTKNIDGSFKWNSQLNVSFYKDKVDKYYLANPLADQFIGNSTSVPVSGIEGKPIYSIFAYRWAGLDPQTGEPQGYVNGNVSKDWTNIVYSGSTINDLQFFGSAIPTKYGSFINSFLYKGISIDLGITYKLGYWFRRQSINYTNLFTSWIGHEDYSQRWQQPGDENRTNIPSNTWQSDYSRDAFYRGSSVLIDKGDHIRLQYINLGYTLNKEAWKKIPFNSIQLYFNINNIGVIWRANKNGIDPDYNIGNNTLIPSIGYALGLRVKL